MRDSLMVMADGVRMGTLSRNGKNLAFHYEPSWLESPRRFPLSLSMPLALKEHPHAAIEPFLWGLLPDNLQTLEEWGIDRAKTMIARMTDALPTVAHALHAEGIVDPVIGKLVEGICVHAMACQESLGRDGV